MPPIYPFNPLHGRSLNSLLGQIAKEIETLEACSVFVEHDGPHEATTEPGFLLNVVVVGVAAMRSGLVLAYAFDLDVRQLHGRGRVIVDESRSFQATVAGEGSLIRYDSGHRSHKSYPHLDDLEWGAANGVDHPSIDLTQEVSLHDFAMAVHEWRDQNQALLPFDPPDLTRVRRPG